MQKVCMLIGLPGSGKSTWAKDVLNYITLYGNSNLVSDLKLFSSDEYDDLIEHVKNGGSAIYDATNINRKSRKTRSSC